MNKSDTGIQNSAKEINMVSVLINQNFNSFPNFNIQWYSSEKWSCHEQILSLIEEEGGGGAA